jgi:hypothetical protein
MEPANFLDNFSLMINYQKKINNSFFRYRFLFQFYNLLELAKIDFTHFLNLTFNLNIEIIPFNLPFNNFLTLKNFHHFSLSLPETYCWGIHCNHFRYESSKIIFFRFTVDLDSAALLSNSFSPQTNDLHKKSVVNHLPLCPLIHQATVFEIANQFLLFKHPKTINFTQYLSISQ